MIRTVALASVGCLVAAAWVAGLDVSGWVARFARERLGL